MEYGNMEWCFLWILESSAAKHREEGVQEATREARAGTIVIAPRFTTYASDKEINPEIWKRLERTRAK
jgi:hypothetical protein